MDKKILSVYISGGVFALLIIIITIVFIMGFGNEPVNIITTALTKDMASSLLENYCEIDSEKAAEYIENKEINEAYLELLNNSESVILASDIDNDTIEWLELNGVEIETTTIARDGLVFINNINNPIENLTVAQLKGAYSGKNKNWTEFSGLSEEIIAYSPRAGSEEEYMMKKFMGNKAIAQPRYRLEDATLESLVKAATKYLDTRTKAMFYTTFHNIKGLNNDELRTLKIDDIEASDESIKNVYYPATMNIYAIIRSDTPEDSQTRKFVEYIISKNGQAIIEQCGYVNLLK